MERKLDRLAARALAALTLSTCVLIASLAMLLIR